MGLGYIGQEIARAALQSEEVELIGAVDKSPSISGRKMSDVLGVPAGTFKVQSSLAPAVQRRQGVVLLHATGSKLPQVKDQILEAISHGMHVVSTCEELARARLRSGKLPQLEHRRRPIAVIDDGAHA